MKSILTSLLICLVAMIASGSMQAQEAMSEDTIKVEKKWKPEFTLRNCVSFGTSGPILTGGAKFNDKFTIGLMLSHGKTYLQESSGYTYGDLYSINTGVAFRGYLHFGPKKIISLYCDVISSIGWIYRAVGDDGLIKDNVTGDEHGNIQDQVGKTRLGIGCQPGIRLRFAENIHIFCGPTFATDMIGFHFGFGF